MQTLKFTWNMRVNLYSHVLLAEAKQYVKFGVPKRMGQNIQHFKVRKLLEL